MIDWKICALQEPCLSILAICLLLLLILVSCGGYVIGNKIYDYLKSRNKEKK
jgi:hypothetical protein